MENDSVEIALLRELHEVLDGLRSIGPVHFDLDVSHVRFYDDDFLLHGLLLLLGCIGILG